MAHRETSGDEGGGLTPVASITLNPVRLTPDGLLEFRRQIELTIRYEPYQERRPPGQATLVSRAQAMRQIALTRRTVVNPALVVDYSDVYPLFPLHTDYVIITDSQRWDVTTMTPVGSAEGTWSRASHGSPHGSGSAVSARGL